MLPLEGITVVSIEQAVAAPFASRQLADLGARVIKVERPGRGDFARDYDETVNGLSSHFTWLNRSKESLAIDLKEEESKALLLDILKDADVFIQNLAPGAIDRLGLGTEVVRERNPKLITVSISGYGENGSYRDKKAYDLLIQCEAGAVSVTGTEETPSKTGISIADIAAGMYTYSGVLTALLARGKTGEGTHLEISMLEALGEWMNYPLYYEGIGNGQLQRTGASHATIFPYGPFQTADQTVFLGIQNDREWERFCLHVLEDEVLANNPRYQTNAKRNEDKDKLAQIIDQKLSTLSSKAVIKRLDEQKIANARLNTMSEFREHPQLKERNRWREVDSPNGRVPTLIPPVTTPLFDVVMNPIPAVGEHTEAIRKEFSAPVGRS
ncbi:CaiB/BaiF CoA transferase family protein [Shouchella sp. JSM 1781072]|uniref:CaiB/BaiF CoA transferase family protein n=1 Tax=Bacillaceae TaxID=186817 RepID=UPI000C08607A|nr:MULTISPECIES: CaiB/BaiF CoA-transferase family protein [Bacillaceae]UTR06924.1 CoA transferase [Alkalihalobacillus sp. LMS6]